MWGIYNYHISTVLLVPMVAGLASWEGARLARAATLLGVSGRPARALSGAWAALMVWTSLAYLAGLVGVVALVKAAGTPGSPGVHEVVTVFPALGLLGAWAALGLAAAWLSRSRFMAPIGAAAAFAVTVYLWAAPPGLFVVVGGATASLIGLVPNEALVLAQSLFFAALVVAALYVCANRPEWPRRSARGSVWVVAAVAATAPWVVAAGDALRAEPVQVECVGSGPEVCLTAGYADRLDSVRSTVLPYVTVLTDMGLPTPERLTQDPYDTREGSAVVGRDVIMGDASSVTSTILAWYMPEGCDLFRDPAVFEAFGGFYWWLDNSFRQVPEYDPSIPDVIKNGPPEATRMWLMQAVATLRSCQP